MASETRHDRQTTPRGAASDTGRTPDRGGGPGERSAWKIELLVAVLGLVLGLVAALLFLG